MGWGRASNHALRRMLARSLLCILLALGASPAFAQVDGAKVNAAIDRGVDWLLRIQRLDGTWSAHEHGNYQSGPTALALLTLLKCGVPEAHPAVRRALAYLEAHPPHKTYSLGCYLMALWWVPAGHVPTVAEGMARIAQIERHGPTETAFTFRQPFPAPDGSPARPVLDECA